MYDEAQDETPASFNETLKLHAKVFKTLIKTYFLVRLKNSLTSDEDRPIMKVSKE